MGATVCDAVRAADDMELVACVDPFCAGGDIAESADAISAAQADVAVDFTVAAAARDNLRWCAANNVHAVVGTTGFTEAELAEFAELFDRSQANAVIAPNFAIGAVLLVRFAELAAPYF